jgi:eukaryotic-like serine/threonine-protein kinase
VTNWSPDGRHLLLGVPNGIQVLPVTSGKSGSSLTPLPFVTDQRETSNGQFSPDGRWVVYQSASQAGGVGIFVEAFPDRGKRQQVAEFGNAPRWRSDGKELYYQVLGGVVTAVDVSEDDGSLQFGPPRTLFGPIISGRPYTYDVSADGK